VAYRALVKRVRQSETTERQVEVRCVGRVRGASRVVNRMGVSVVFVSVWEWLVLGGIAILVAVSGVGRKPAQVTVVLLLGDSLAVGLDVPLSANLADGGIVLETRAETGSTAMRWRGVVTGLLVDVRPDLLLVSLGTNDCVRNDIDVCRRFGGNMRQIQRHAEAVGVRVVVLVPSWVEWAPRIRGHLIGMTLLEAPAVELQGDGVHPTAAGYREWARSIGAALKGKG